MTYCIEFPEPDTAVEWSLTAEGAARETVDYRPRFYVSAPGNRSLATVEDALGDHPAVNGVERERHRPGWRDDPTGMLAIEVSEPATVRGLATTVAGVGRPGDYRCFNVDLSPGFRYCVETDTDPTPARTPTVLELSAAPTAISDPPLDTVRVTDPMGETHAIEGPPETVARGVESVVAEHDPDVLGLSTAELVPTLCDAVGDAPLRLGREPGYTKLASASSYESYGQVGHSPARYDVPGRVIVDDANSFLREQSNLAGLLDLVERSRKPLQEAAWAGIGNVLTAIQIRAALARDVLVPWRSWRAERFKSARTLEAADRGGYTTSPDVGVHENVHELDFSSLYPNIMCTRNVSPETVCCDCHPEREDVPGLGYSICPDPGYLPDVLQPLIDDRDEYKRAIREGDGTDAAEAASAAIKWILVACFGYQGFSNAKFGRIECHEAINAFAREIFLDAKATFEQHGWRVVHGIVDSLWVTPMADREQTDVDVVAERISDDVGIRLEHEATYDWIAFCPRRNDDAGALTRYFGKEVDTPVGDDASYKRRGIEARQRSTPSFVTDVQRDLIRTFGRTRSPEATCERLRQFLDRLDRGSVDPERLAITNRVSKRREAYSQSTRNVAALERAADLGVDTQPGQDVEYVVVDDAKRSRERVALLAEEPEGYDAAFYRDELLRAAESVLSPAGLRREGIERQLAERVDGSLTAFGD